MGRLLLRIGAPVLIVSLLLGALVWFLSHLSNSPQNLPQAEYQLGSAVSPPSPTINPETAKPSPVRIDVAAVPWTLDNAGNPVPVSPSQPTHPRNPAPAQHNPPTAAQPHGSVAVAAVPWTVDKPASVTAHSSAAPSEPHASIAVAALPWQLDANGAVRTIPSASPTSRPSPAGQVAAIASVADIPTATLPWLAAPRPKHLAHPSLPRDSLEYAQAISNCPPELIDWLKAWEADQAAHQSTSDARLQALSQILISTPLTFAQLFDLGQRLQNVEGDRVGVLFYHAAEPLAAAELAPFAVDDPKAKPVLNMMWEMQWCLGRTGDWDSALANVTLLVKYSPPPSRESVLAQYQFAEATYEANHGQPEARDKAIAIYQQLLDRDGAARLDDKQRNGVHWAMGVILFQSEQYADAAAHLTKAAEKSDAYYNADARSMLVMSLARQNNATEAQKQLGQLVQDFPDGSLNMQAGVEVRLATERAAKQQNGASP
jgi:tetratricopeptide (TPR) repeat protein